MSKLSKNILSDHDIVSLGTIRRNKTIDEYKSSINHDDDWKIIEILKLGYSPTVVHRKIVKGCYKNYFYIRKLAEDNDCLWNRSDAYIGSKNPNYNNPTNYKHTKRYNKKERSQILGNHGKYHWKWRGGVGVYPDDFNNKIRFFIHILDNFTCRNCGATYSDSKKHNHVHHIDCDKNNTNIDNLCLMCPSCHSGGAHLILEQNKNNIYNDVKNERYNDINKIISRLFEIFGQERLIEFDKIYEIPDWLKNNL